MPADFTEYINLTVFDKEPGDIYRDAIELARLTLPDFNLRTGTPEDAIFQAMSYISAHNIASINRLPNRLMSGIVSLMGYQRQEAVSAEIDVEIYLDTYDGAVIPYGTTFTYDTIFEDEIVQYAFWTTEIVEIAAVDPETAIDYPSALVTLTCIEAGIIPPIEDNVDFTIVSSGTPIQSCTTASPNNFANGINADTDEDYLSRAATYIRSTTQALVRASQIEAYILTAYPDIVSRCKVYDLTNGDDTSGQIGVYRSQTIDSISLTSDVVTVILDEASTFVVGENITVSIIDATPAGIFNGNYEVTYSSGSTIRFALVHANVASTPITSGTVHIGDDVSGYVTIFVYGFNTYVNFLEKSSIIADVRNKAVAGLSFEILDPTLVSFDIGGEISVYSTYISADVQTSVENVLIDYLSPSTFPYSVDRIRNSQIVSLISQIPGVAYVSNINFSNYLGATDWIPTSDSDGRFKIKGTLPNINIGNIDITYVTIDG